MESVDETSILQNAGSSTDADDEEVESVHVTTRRKKKEHPKTCCQRLCSKILKRSTQQELRQLFDFAWPVLLSNTFILMITTITIFFCGRLGKAELGAATLATSFTNVTGFSVGFGLTAAMDTLCTQAFGANKKKRVGVILQRSLVIIGLSCLPIWGLWLNTRSIVGYLVKDPDVVKLTGLFLDYYIPALPGLLVGLILQKYLQTQGLVKPPIYVGALTNIIHVVFNYVLIFPLDLGLKGASIAAVLSNISLGFFTWAYIKWKRLHVDTWGGWSKDCLAEWGQFIHLAVPGMLMICIEWWGFEIGTFLMGNLGVDILGAHGILFQINCVIYMIPLSIGVATGIRVGMALGEGKYEQARNISNIAVKFTLCLELVIVIIINGCKNVLGYIFTDNSDVVGIASVAVPALTAVLLFDSLQSVLSGAIRGCGIQRMGAIATFICYDLIAVPLALVLAFLTKLRLVGFWIGIATGILFQVLSYFIFLWRLNWKEQARLARSRAGITSSPDQKDEVLDGESKSLLADDKGRPRSKSQPWDSSLSTSVPPAMGAFIGRKKSGLMLPAEIFLRQVKQREVTEHPSFGVYTISYDAHEDYVSVACSRSYGAIYEENSSVESASVHLSRNVVCSRFITLLILLALFAAGIIGRCYTDITQSGRIEPHSNFTVSASLNYSGLP